MRTTLEIAFGFFFIVAFVGLMAGFVALSMLWNIRMANATIGISIAGSILIVGCAVFIANLPR